MDRQVVNNAFHLGFSRLFDTLVFFFILITLGRSRGIDDVAIYSVVFSFVGLFLVIGGIDRGIILVEIRWLSKNRSRRNASYCYWNYLIFRILVSFFMYFLLVLAANLFGLEHFTRTIIYLYGSLFFIEAFTMAPQLVFESYQKMFYSSPGVIVKSTIVLIFGIYTLLQDYSLIYLFFTIIAAEIMQAVLTNTILIKRFFRPKMTKINFSLWKEWISQGFSVYAQLTSDYAKFHFSVLILSLTLGNYFVAIYSVADRIKMAIVNIYRCFLGAVFPHYCSYKLSGKYLQRNFLGYVGLTLVLGAGVSAFLLLFSNKLIISLFGVEFKQSVILLRFLSVELVFLLINRNIMTFMNSVGKEAAAAKIQVGMLAFGILLLISLLPYLGVVAVVMASLVASIIQSLVLFVYLKNVGKQRCCQVK